MSVDEEHLKDVERAKRMQQHMCMNSILGLSAMPVTSGTVLTVLFGCFVLFIYSTSVIGTESDRNNAAMLQQCKSSGGDFIEYRSYIDYRRQIYDCIKVGKTNTVQEIYFVRWDKGSASYETRGTIIEQD